MEKRFYVYALLDPTRPGRFAFGEFCFLYEPFYIGKGCGTRCYRSVGKQERTSRPRSPKVKRVNKIVESGKQPLPLKIVCDLSEDEAYKTEIEVISLIGRQIHGDGPLTNFERGGGGSAAKRLSPTPSFKGRKHTPETIAKMSAAHRARPPKDQAHRDKIAAALTGRKLPEEVKLKLLGRPSWAKGKKLPPLSEDRKAACRAHRHSAETRAKISDAGRRPCSPETRAKIGAANQGRPSRYKGKSRPAEVGAKISASLRGRKLSRESIEKMKATKAARRAAKAAESL